MKIQLTQLMQSMHLTATRFADLIGVQRSSISHILSGRNQPSYEFILKLITRFPEINVEWLLTGKGNMLKNKITDHEKDKHKQVTNGKLQFPDLPDISDSNEKATTEHESTLSTTNQNQKFTNVNKLKRLLVLFDDGTFEDYRERQDHD